MVWNEGDVVGLRLREDLHTVAQMMRNPCLRFFRVANGDGVWRDLDLDRIPVLFTGFVGRAVLQELAEGKVRHPSVRPSRQPLERHWIKPDMHFGGSTPWRGGRLIESVEGVGTSRWPVVRGNLEWGRDREIIERHELTNMWGPRDLSERLTRFFDCGVDRDPTKESVFEIS